MNKNRLKTEIIDSFELYAMNSVYANIGVSDELNKNNIIVVAYFDFNKSQIYKLCLLNDRNEHYFNIDIENNEHDKLYLLIRDYLTSIMKKEGHQLNKNELYFKLLALKKRKK